MFMTPDLLEVRKKGEGRETQAPPIVLTDDLLRCDRKNVEREFFIFTGVKGKMKGKKIPRRAAGGGGYVAIIADYGTGRGLKGGYPVFPPVPLLQAPAPIVFPTSHRTCERYSSRRSNCPLRPLTSWHPPLRIAELLRLR